MTLAEAEKIQIQRHGGGLTTEQLGELMLATVRAMSADEKAHLRARMNKSVGIVPKSSEGKPS